MRIHLTQRQRRIRQGALPAMLLFCLAAFLAWRFFSKPAPSEPMAAAGRDLTLAEAQEVQVDIVPGDSGAGVLMRGGLEAREAARLIADIRPAYDLARIRSGQVLALLVRSGFCQAEAHPRLLSAVSLYVALR